MLERVEVGAGAGDAGGAGLKPGALDSLPEAWRERLQHAESLAVLGSLVGGFAHDLNSPLGVLLTSASMLQERAELIRDELERGARRGPVRVPSPAAGMRGVEPAMCGSSESVLAAEEE